VSGEHVSPRWAHWRNDIDLVEYHGRWARMEAQGKASHGEADLIESLHPSSVLDAGCGMGRVAIELDRRGIAVQGADLDADLLAYAQADAPHLDWHLADLATMQLDHRFHLVAMPGNVMIFCRPSDRALIVDNLARHLLPAGLLVAGFALERRDGAITLDEYDEACAAAGLMLDARYGTWEREPYDGRDYAVSVHRLAV